MRIDAGTSQCVCARNGRRVERLRRQSPTALAQRRLQLFGVRKMRDERRADLNEQRFQLRVLSTGNQRLIHGVENGLMIGNLMVDIGLVKRMAIQVTQVSKILVAALFQALACWITFGRYMQLCDEVNGRFVDTAMVGDHELRKVFDFLRMCSRLRKLTGVDIDLICGHDDRSNLRIGRPGTLGPDPSSTRDENAGARDFNEFYYRLPQ
jgi:hypothetical protein